MSEITNFPRQQMSFSKKNKTWRKQCCDWADSKTFFNHSLVRKSVIHKKINYDLLIGKLHMSDLQSIINPDNVDAGYVPDKIQHYPIMNSKLEVLQGEETKRVFDYKVIVTNPNSVAEIENNKKTELHARLQQIIQNTSQSEEEFNQELEKLNEYFTHDWQDMREIRANNLLNHYMKEYNIPLLFNKGFLDAMTVGEEVYQCDIVGGEPIIERVNPLKIRVFKSGYSNKIEDADIIILEDYWSPGKIIDTYYDVLTKKDMEYIETLPDNVGQSYSDSMDNVDERRGFIHASMIDDVFSDDTIDPMSLFNNEYSNTLMPYDLAGNIRVLRIYWKSRRKIKKIKSYNELTGEEEFNFYPETYITNTDMGEEEEIFYINEAWEGTKIGTDIYLNMRPKVVQYNRLSNPSRCHFGIIGSIYNVNDNKPFSLVDKMKQYNYLYDVIHDRMNKIIARNWGKIITLDLAKVPKGWDVEKWMHYAKIHGLAVVDSFNEGSYGAATGKLAGGLNNASSGVIDAEFGNSIQQLMNLLEFIKMEMAEVSGISRQREGQISNRETVGGVERATLQSSHITEWLFTVHDDVRKRVLECFLETAKIALQGRNKKFQYLLSDNSMKIMDIDGDEFAEADYGLLLDNSQGTQMLAQKIDMLAQAALQNQTLNFSTIMKLYNSCSLAEKQKMVENNEKALQQQQQQQQQEAMKQQQAAMEQEAAIKQQEVTQREAQNIRDNETRIAIAKINANVSLASSELNNEYSEKDRDILMKDMKELDEKMALEREKLAFERVKLDKEIASKEKISKNKPAPRVK